ncbi:MAG: hypothetical protein MI799_15675, partial [Desulfobacterales bacterium]|nr:hypothetical protein [Desulfobacterales bacterium]
MPNFEKITEQTLYTVADTSRIKAVIGGRSTDYFAPSINVGFEFESGKEQVFFNICDDPGQLDTSKATESHDGDKISIVSGDVESNFVLSDYSVKINRVFNSIPTEAPRYKLAYSEGVEFYY